MKTRAALIYLSVFLLLAGYFYYFEVVRRQQRLEQQQAAHHLFHLQEAEVTALRLERANGARLKLKKSNGHWQILEPLDTRADDFAVRDLLSSLRSLRMERQVETATADLHPYGLEKPNLQLFFLAAGRWHRLRIGGKSPVADQFYASGDLPKRVVLISGSSRKSLDKSLFDLRRKELFSLDSEAVRRIEVRRPRSSVVLLRAGKQLWQAPAAPGVKIKTSKVESLLNRLIWLRALRFVPAKGVSRARFGLEPPRLKVTLSTSERTETLLLGNHVRNRGIYASTQGLPGVAMVDEALLKELPQRPRDLEDRSLLAFKNREVVALNLELDGRAARLRRQNDSWTRTVATESQKVENWRVNSLLWNLQDLEYLPGVPPRPQPPPERCNIRLDLFGEKGRSLGTLLFAEVAAASKGRARLWCGKPPDGSPRPYWVRAESLQGLEQSIKNLLTPQSAAE